MITFQTVRPILREWRAPVHPLYGYSLSVFAIARNEWEEGLDRATAEV
jgi:hypothetical protein